MKNLSSVSRCSSEEPEREISDDFLDEPLEKKRGGNRLYLQSIAPRGVQPR